MNTTISRKNGQPMRAAYWGRMTSVALMTGVLVLASACSQSQSEGPNGYDAKSVSGEVSFSLTPRGIAEDHFVVDVHAETQSGDLSEFDMREAATLRTGGRTYHPTAATSLRGQRANGALQFPLTEAPADFEIIISGVRGMPAATLRWP